MGRIMSMVMVDESNSILVAREVIIIRMEEDHFIVYGVGRMLIRCI